MPTISRAKAWVWADQPTAPNYTPSTSYQYNSGRGINQISRLGVGQYQIDLPGLGTSGGMAQVSAYNGNHYCKVVNWVNIDGTQRIRVNCFSANGLPVDGQFVLLFYKEDRSTGWNDAYLWADQPSAASYTPSSKYQWNSKGLPNTVRRLSKGRYQATLPGLNIPGGTVLVTGYGAGSERCKVGAWNLSGTNTVVDVYCYDVSGNPVDMMYTLSFMTDVGLGVSLSERPRSLDAGLTTVSVSEEQRYGAYVWANEPTSAAYTPSSTYQINTAGATNTISRSAVGSYKVNLPKMATSSSTAALVTAYGSGSEYCTVQRWGSDGGSGTNVFVQCFDRSGTPVDTQFALLYLTDRPIPLVSGLSGAIGSRYRSASNELTFVEFGGKLSTLKLNPVTVMSSGTTTLKGTFTLDLDQGTQGGDFTKGDIWWQQETTVQRKMTPISGAKIVNLGVTDFNQVTAIQLKDYSYSSNGINGNNDATNQLVNGDVFLVYTNKGNFTKVQVIQYGYDMKIQWVTYHLGPLYQVLGNGYQMPEDVAIAADNQTAYVTERSGNLLRVNLSNAERLNAAVVAANLRAPHQMVLDEARRCIYLVEYAIPGRLMKINLDNGDQTVVVNDLENAIGLLISQDLRYAYISEQAPSGGRVVQVDLSTLQKKVLVQDRPAPFMMTWVDDSQTALYLVERDPADQLFRLDLSSNVLQLVADRLPSRPSSVAVISPGQLLVCSNSVISKVSFGFDPSGPLLLGIGFVPKTRITADGKADTSVDPAYFFQVKDAPFGGTLPININHKKAYDLGARHYQILVDGVVRNDVWSDYCWNAVKNEFELKTITPRVLPLAGAGAYYPIRRPDQLWYNAYLGSLLDTTNLTNGLPMHSIRIDCINDLGAVLLSDTIQILVDNYSTIAKLGTPTLSDGTVTDQVCGVLRYADRSRQVSIALTASHPTNSATYSFNLVKGVNALSAFNQSGPVSTAPLLPVEANVDILMGDCQIAAFVANLYVATTAINGWGRLSGYDSSAQVAFTLVPSNVPACV